MHSWIPNKSVDEFYIKYSKCSLSRESCSSFRWGWTAWARAAITVMNYPPSPFLSPKIYCLSFTVWSNFNKNFRCLEGWDYAPRLGATVSRSNFLLNRLHNCSKGARESPQGKVKYSSYFQISISILTRPVQNATSNTKAYFVYIVRQKLKAEIQVGPLLQLDRQLELYQVLW